MTGPVANLARAFGAPEPPFSKTDVGTGIVARAGSQPTGRIATEKIVAAGRYDLLRVVARGLNPEGRVDAAGRSRSAGLKRQPADCALIDTLLVLRCAPYLGLQWLRRPPGDLRPC